MKKLAHTTVLALAVGMGSLAMSNAALANSSKRFVSTIEAPTTAIKINVTLGEDLAYRAEHISTDLRDRANARSNRDGFSGNGFFGQKDLDKLSDRLKVKMTTQLEKNGLIISDDATTVLNLVITDAKPNRPTFEQLSHSPSLSYNSFGIGGAKFEGTMVSENGEQGEISYKWFENDFRQGQYGGTWSDANRAIDRFARKTAKALQ